MKIYLDDERPAPQGWTLLRWPDEVIARLEAGGVTHLSLDHDLGDDARGTGYDVIVWIERAVALEGFEPPQIAVHSANAAARGRMEQGAAAIERLARAREAPVEIVDYDPTWPARFEVERAALEVALGPWLAPGLGAAGPIEHIGSTAIPGMPAKPVIDIMAAVTSLDASRPAIDAAASLGYLHFPYKPALMHWFCKPSPALRTHHLHLVPLAAPLWRERLAFRDRLRRDAALAREYAALKRALAERHRRDREAYTEAKGPFVARVLGLEPV